MSMTLTRRRSALSLLLAVLAAAILSTGLITAPARAAVAGAAANPVGRWITTVSIPGKPDSVVTLDFLSGHVVTITGPTGGDGLPLYAGGGLWTSDGAALNFTLVHPLPAADGTLLGIVHGSQCGRMDGRTFSSSGVSYLYKPDGTV